MFLVFIGVRGIGIGLTGIDRFDERLEIRIDYERNSHRFEIMLET
jgi:hypothetical protein